MIDGQVNEEKKEYQMGKIESIILEIYTFSNIKSLHVSPHPYFHTTTPSLNLPSPPPPPFIRSHIHLQLTLKRRERALT